MTTYGDLYDYVESHWGKQSDKYSFQLVEEFCRLHGIEPAKLTPMLKAWGGKDDLEVYLNLQGTVPRDADLATFIQTPAEWASRHGLYCRRGMAGWEPCERNDEGATFDLSTAIEQMFQAGIAGD